jgi:hypothetical protein
MGRPPTASILTGGEVTPLVAGKSLNRSGPPARVDRPPLRIGI